MKKPVTLQQAIVYFGDADRAFEYAKWLRWPDGKVICPRCDSEKVSFVNAKTGARKLWFCNGCKKQFTLKVGTIFEDSPITLDKWMTAFWMICNCKNGISSYELHRSLGVSQKSAWFMLHRIREAMKSGSLAKMGGSDSGPIEIDETYVGGLKKNMHKDRRIRYEAKGGPKGKATVMGMLDREARQVRAKVIPNVGREVLQNQILNNIEKGSKLHTDAWASYDDLYKNFVHKTVNHVNEYVRGEVHTNGIENFWSLLKRGLKGTYVAVEPFHLDRYVAEQVFRFNNRATKDNPLTDEDRFTLAMMQAVGRRLTYAQLMGNGAD